MDTLLKTLKKLVNCLSEDLFRSEFDQFLTGLTQINPNTRSGRIINRRTNNAQRFAASGEYGAARFELGSLLRELRWAKN